MSSCLWRSQRPLLAQSGHIEWILTGWFAARRSVTRWLSHHRCGTSVCLQCCKPGSIISLEPDERSPLRQRVKKIGLISGKKVYCIVASGSVFAHGPFVADDQFTPYIRVALEYIGITDLQFIRVDGTHYPVTRSTTFPHALQAIDRLC